MNSNEIKVALLQYYRYDRQYKLVALKSQHFHSADVVCVNGRGWVIETEVKTSISDMKADLNKPKHQALRRDYLKDHPDQEPLLHPKEWGYEYKYSGHRFNFAIPEELLPDATPVRNTYYPYAGLILVRPQPYYGSLSMFGIKVQVEPYHYQKPKADIKLLVALVKDQSATLTRLAVENCRLTNAR